MNSFELYKIGSELFRNGDYEKAKIFLQNSINIEPHFKAYELIGTIFLNQNEPAIAILYFSAAVCLNTQVKQRVLLSMAFYRLGNFSDAAKFANEAIKIESGNKMAKWVLSSIEA